MKIGEIYLMNFEGKGSEQTGWRPGLIFQNNKGNSNSPNVIALPLSKSIKKLDQPTHVIIPKCVGLKHDSIVLCENPTVMSKEKVGKYLTTLPDEYMEGIVGAYLLASSAISYIKPEALLYYWQRAVCLNSNSI